MQGTEILCRSCEQKTGDNMFVGAVCREAGSRVRLCGEGLLLCLGLGHGELCAKNSDFL